MKHFLNFVQDRNVLIVCCSLKNGSHRGQLMMTTYIACSSGQCDPNSATACTGRIRSLGNKYDSYHSGRTPHAGRQATSKLLKIGFRVAIFRQNETHIKNSSRHADSYTIVIEGKSKCRDILCESLAWDRLLEILLAVVADYYIYQMPGSVPACKVEHALLSEVATRFQVLLVIHSDQILNIMKTCNERAVSPITDKKSEAHRATPKNSGLRC
jgi:hypothetical protein